MRQWPSRRIVILSLVVLVLLLPTPATGVSVLPTVSPSSSDATPSELDAIRFRETFGFESSLAFVRTAAAEPSRYSDLAYGVPLDATEVAELARRAAIQAAIHPMVEQVAAGEAFAGMYLDQHAGGAPVFMFTANLADRGNELL
jgi:hypothetical protein